MCIGVRIFEFFLFGFIWASWMFIIMFFFSSIWRVFDYLFEYVFLLLSLSVFLRYSHCAYPGVLNDVPHFSEVPFICLHSFSSVLFRLCISTGWSSSFFAGCSNLLWSFCNTLLKILVIVFPISLWFFLEFFLFCVLWHIAIRPCFIVLDIVSFGSLNKCKVVALGCLLGETSESPQKQSPLPLSFPVYESHFSDSLCVL